MDKIANELVGIAKELVGKTKTAGYKSKFMVLRPLVLDKEGEDTRTSLSNLRKILAAGYTPVDGVYRWNKSRAIWNMEVFFRDRDFNLVVSHNFLGFSVGYHGEGSRGMMEAGKMMSMNFDKKKVFGELLPEEGVSKLRDLK